MLDNCEIWKDIKGYEGNYQISNNGRIWSVLSQRYMKPQHDECGYYRIQLTAKNGKRKTEKVHRLVAINFIDNPNNLPEVNHINHIRDDNRVENLEWCNHKDNCNKTKKVRKVGKYDKDGNLVCVYKSLSDASYYENKTPSHILSYINSKPSKLRQYVWKYIN